MGTLPVTGEQTILRPDTALQAGEAVAWALAANQPLELRGTGSKQGLGQATVCTHCLDLSALTGIIAYEPDELVLTARAGTPMAEILPLLASRRQHLAFEVSNPNILWDAGADLESGGTLGGVVAAALAGPRRLCAGSVRDHVLGYQGVNGRGELYKAGAAVVKNVTGYDLPKLMAGSMGTLTALTEITVKVLPAPEEAATLLLSGLDDMRAIAAMIHGMKSPHEVSGATHLPEELARLSCVPEVADAGVPITALRLEGFAPSVRARVIALGQMMPQAVALADGPSRLLWQEIADVAFFARSGAFGERRVWRMSVPPASGAVLARALGDSLAFVHFYDWGGGLLWLATDGTTDVVAEAAIIRKALAGTAGSGHATLMRATTVERSLVPVFQPQAAAVAALSARVARNFDPQGLFNPGRLNPQIS